jgi:hypothetical protein
MALTRNLHIDLQNAAGFGDTYSLTFTLDERGAYISNVVNADTGAVMSYDERLWEDLYLACFRGLEQHREDQRRIQEWQQQSYCTGEDCCGRV